MTATATHTVIVGLGKTGLSCARFLTNRRAHISVVDSRQQPPGIEQLQTEFAEIDVHVGGFDESLINSADELVLSPGVPLSEPALASAIAKGVSIVGDIELFAQNVTAPVVAITGTNGKSTVTSLLAEMARCAKRHYKVGGNLGTPALDLLGDDDIDLYILELSSFQLETTYSLNAVAAIVLNVAPDHMDRYDSLASYAATKQRIYHGDGVMVINKDDAIVLAMRDPSRKTIYFTLSEPLENEYGLIEKDQQLYLAYGNNCVMRASDVKLPGRHNLANVLAAMALAEAIGLPESAVIEAITQFAGLPHRCQWVAEIDGVNFYNDSKATNVGASVAALEGMPGTTVLIAGGQGKGTDYTPLVDAVRKHAAAVVLIGEEAEKLANVMMGSVPLVHAGSMQDAVQQAFALAKQTQSQVLLAPACASFDMFRNFEHRGECFVAAVQEMQT